MNILWLSPWKRELYFQWKEFVQSLATAFHRASGFIPNEVSWQDMDHWSWKANLRVVDAETGVTIDDSIWRVNQSEGWYDRRVATPGEKFGVWYQVAEDGCTLLTERVERKVRLVLP